MNAAKSYKVISEADYQFYQEQGYLFLPNLVPPWQIEKIQQSLNKLVERSRSLTASNSTFDLEAGHTAQNPKLRRIAFLDDLDPYLWEFASDSVVTDLAADLLSPNLTFRECISNFKWKKGGQEVKMASGYSILPSYESFQCPGFGLVARCRRRPGSSPGHPWFS